MCTGLLSPELPDRLVERRNRSTGLRRNAAALMLWSLLFLFFLRVLGQLLVAIGGASFLPPMDEWYSGLLRYPQLLASQILIIVLCGKVSLDFTRRDGVFFSVPQRRSGLVLLGFGALYFTSMLVRYALTMKLLPQKRWTGGVIPIFFHLVLAAFILQVGNVYHKRLENS
jgi:uncharacterized protein